MLRYRTAQRKNNELPKMPYQLAQIDRNGKIGVLLSSVINWVTNIKNTFLPPTALKMMKSCNPSSIKYKLNLRTIGSGGEALGEDLLEWGKKILGVGINEFYGQTECNLTISNSGAIMPTKQGSIGKPVPGHEVRIMNDRGELIKEPGIDGEIVVKNDTPVAFLKYWENDKETNNKVINGWLHTGDFAYRDDEGYFYFKGREDDIINTSGYRVGPSEVEDCILSHPQVDMVAVIGVPVSYTHLTLPTKA